MPLGEPLTLPTPRAEACVCPCLPRCPPRLRCMWVSRQGEHPQPPGRCLGPRCLLISCYPAAIRSWGHPGPRGGGCCSMQGFVLRAVARRRGARGRDPLSPPLSPQLSLKCRAPEVSQYIYQAYETILKN